MGNTQNTKTTKRVWIYYCDKMFANSGLRLKLGINLQECILMNQFILLIGLLVFASFGIALASSTQSLTPPQSVLIMTMPDSTKQQDLEIEHQRHLNDLLFKIKSLDDVDKLGKVNPEDRIRLKKAFATANPEVVLRQAAEKKGKAKK
ncbi:MAG: hypothetical protein JWO30_3178 [Fibrobacteres bacterium]|nr:hypothetical protein [Fibrobacterota bacterium]